MRIGLACVLVLSLLLAPLAIGCGGSGYKGRKAESEHADPSAVMKQSLMTKPGTKAPAKPAAK